MCSHQRLRPLLERCLQQHCRSLIAGYKCPRSIEVLPALPRILSTNKIDKRKLREPYWPSTGRQIA